MSRNHVVNIEVRTPGRLSHEQECMVRQVLCNIMEHAGGAPILTVVSDDFTVGTGVSRAAFRRRHRPARRHDHSHILSRLTIESAHPPHPPIQHRLGGSNQQIQHRTPRRTPQRRNRQPAAEQDNGVEALADL
ncbi:MAG: hypothetical protein KJZ69_16480 [Phycisphaerales bacterium]|nr:hypothetical protein [Phycisphaerales bacterium]